MNDVKSLRIGNCSGFMGDRVSAAIELVEHAEIDVLSGDWLAELTMTILQKQRQRDPLKGYASTFLRQIEAVLGTCLDRGIRIVSNAGGVNPAGCAAAVQAVAEALGLDVRVGQVAGDDILDRLDDLVDAGALLDFATREPLDLGGERPFVANAYLGGWGIASALAKGADVVITGRVTDASLVVGPAAWAFEWRRDDWDRLAGAVVAGHVIECGGQATGGNFAFFEEVPGFERIGFPIAEIYPDGSSIITKAEGEGGSVNRDTVTAQLLYEVQSERYLNPDVIARLDSIELQDMGRDRVRIEAVTGEPPTSELKVSLAMAGGYRNAMTLAITGRDSEAKAAVAQRAVWDRLPGGEEAFDEINVELLGRANPDPKTFGEAYALLRIAVRGKDEALVGRGFSSAVVETGLSSYPGFFATTPPTGATSYVVYRPAFVPADEVPTIVTVAGKSENLPSTGAQLGQQLSPEVGTIDPGRGHSISDFGSTTMAPIGLLVGARSGDKGGDANLGIWARDDETWSWLDMTLTSELVRSLIPGAEKLVIEEYRFPRLRAANFILRGFLGDGVSSCLKFDAQAKGLAEYFRSRHVALPDVFLGFDSQR